jgi:hypothetical protein
MFCINGIFRKQKKLVPSGSTLQNIKSLRYVSSHLIMLRLRPLGVNGAYKELTPTRQYDRSPRYLTTMHPKRQLRALQPSSRPL